MTEHPFDPIQRDGLEAEAATSAISVQAITESTERNCPKCHRPILRLYPEAVEAVGQRHWWFDGDTIPGLRRRLQADGKETASISHYVDLVVGCCPHCGEHYFAVGVQMIAAAVDDDFEHRYFRKNGDSGTERNHLVLHRGTIEKAPREWTVATIETPRGRMFHHCLGPFPLDDPDSIIGPYGVSPCQGDGAWPWRFASDLVFEVWNDLASLARGNALGEQR